ncbi:hypothetical protein [uncultured Kordia sp.]|uniref:hypothetical protein n=1 Tax=uncultured Kordia sp. TaxID=507699 RepID=UPI00261E8648|nr:hypothetical protein [uncultured Kordia sp.]
MANQENNTQGMQQTQNAIEFINKSVLTPNVKPMKGTASPMIDQATGMMVQDLQSFLKGFEQVGLVALARLANNILTYGNYYGPKPDSDGNPEGGEDKKSNAKTTLSFDNAEQIGSDAMKGLFSVVGEYGKMKAEISSMIHNNHFKGNDSSQPIPPEDPTPKKASHLVNVDNFDTKTPTPKEAAPVANAAVEIPKTEIQNTRVSASDLHQTSQPENDEKKILTNSFEEIFELLIDTSEQLTEDLHKEEDNFEHRTDNEDDNDDDDTASDQKTYWFPKKK